jgi:hypothetical protein
VRYWSDNNSRRLHGKSLHSERLTVRCGISTVGITGPYFFEDENGLTVTATSYRYVHMLTDFVFPALRNLGLDPATVYFQQDGATAHTARQLIGQPDHRTCRPVIFSCGIPERSREMWKRSVPYKRTYFHA